MEESGDGVDVPQVLLNLPDVRVLSVSKSDPLGEWIIHLQSTLASAVCKRCGREIPDLHGLGEPIRFGVTCPSSINRCFSNCVPNAIAVGPPAKWVGQPRRHNAAHGTNWSVAPTHALMSRWRCVCWSILYAGRYGSQALGERRETIEGILDRYIDTKVNWEQYAHLRLIGIDEVALKKGHRDYVANFITMPLEGGGVSVLGVK